MPWPISRRPGPRIGLGLADAERREVVIEHELLAELVEQAFDALFVADGAERGRDQGLGLAALEQGRAVGARQQADFAVNGADFLEAAAVEPFAFEDQIAEDLFFQSREGRAHLDRRVFRLPAFGQELGLDLLLEGLDLRVALGLDVGQLGFAHLAGEASCGRSRRADWAFRREFLLAAGRLRAQFLDGVDDLDDLFVGEQDGAGHHRLRAVRERSLRSW